MTAHDEELRGQLHEQVTSLEQKMVEQADVHTKASHAQAVALQELQEEPAPVGTVLPNVDEVQPSASVVASVAAPHQYSSVDRICREQHHFTATSCETVETCHLGVRICKG